MDGPLHGTRSAAADRPQADFSACPAERRVPEPTLAAEALDVHGRTKGRCSTKSLNRFSREVLRRNPGEDEFHQAVREVLDSLGAVIAKHPDYAEDALIERICEPERQIIFRVPWVDDSGQVQINRGFRVQFNSALGPYKGGLRFHPSVMLGTVKFLGFEQAFKNALTGMPIGGGKGGSDFDPKGRSDGEIMRFCQSFMTELSRHLGEYTDVPAGDIGVGQREIGYMFGQYKRITNRYESGVLTGKGAGLGRIARAHGSDRLWRRLFRRAHAATRVAGLRRQEGHRVGRRATSRSTRCEKVHATRRPRHRLLGFRMAMFVDENGHRSRRCSRRSRRRGAARVADYAEAARRGRASTFPGGRDLGCAGRHRHALGDAERAHRAGCAHAREERRAWRSAKARTCPARPKPCGCSSTPASCSAPGKAANAGGVATSALEMQQNASRDSWSFEATEAAAARRSCTASTTGARRSAEEYGSPGNYVLGANIAGFIRVAEAMRALGVI